MNKNRRFPAKRLIKLHMLRRRSNKFRTANHMGNVHQMVVDNIGKIICRHPVALQKHLIFQLAVLNRDVPMHHIKKRSCAGQRHFLANDIRIPVFQMALDCVRCKVAAMAAITAESFFLVVLRFLLRAEAAISEALFYQFFRVLFVNLHSLALDIRPAVAADIRPLVRDDMRRRQGILNELHRIADIARAISIFDPKQKITVFCLCEKIGVKRRAQISDMHIPRRAGGKACAYFIQDETLQNC